MVTDAEKRRVGMLIKRHRQARGISTQEKLAALVGTSKTSVAAWESGKHYPTRYIGVLEQILGTSLAEHADPQEQRLREALAELRSLGLPGRDVDWLLGRYQELRHSGSLDEQAS